jgi:hypothetical protein
MNFENGVQLASHSPLNQWNTKLNDGLMACFSLSLNPMSLAISSNRLALFELILGFFILGRQN